MRLKRLLRWERDTLLHQLQADILNLEEHQDDHQLDHGAQTGGFTG